MTNSVADPAAAAAYTARHDDNDDDDDDDGPHSKAKRQIAFGVR